jgi:N-acetylneuraminate synthase/sialic acid synthase
MTERALVVDGRRIADDTPCWVIAEIGHNHQGDVDQARRLLAAAKEAGASAVKLQKRDNRSLFTREMSDRPYEHAHSFGRTYGEHRERLELGREAYQALQRLARGLGLTFFATAFDVPSAEFLAALDVPAFKIASADLRNLPLLRHVARLGKPVIVSTGGGTLADVRRAYETIMPINPRLALLQCTAAYPAVPEELNLRVITTYREAFPDVVIGLSAHDVGTATAVAALALGARIIEKHVTLDRAMKGTDHAFSLDPPGLRAMVRDLACVHAALGDGVKAVYPSERAGIVKMSKKIVAARPLAVGQRVAETDVALRSPGDGLPPSELDRVLGRVMLKALDADEAIQLDMLADEAP